MSKRRLVTNRPGLHPADEVNRLLYVGPFVFGLFIARCSVRDNRYLGFEITIYPTAGPVGRLRSIGFTRGAYRRVFPRLRPHARLTLSRSVISLRWGLVVEPSWKHGL